MSRFEHLIRTHLGRDVPGTGLRPPLDDLAVPQEELGGVAGEKVAWNTYCCHCDLTSTEQKKTDALMNSPIKLKPLWTFVVFSHLI